MIWIKCPNPKGCAQMLECNFKFSLLDKSSLRVQFHVPKYECQSLYACAHVQVPKFQVKMTNLESLRQSKTST